MCAQIFLIKVQHVTAFLIVHSVNSAYLKFLVFAINYCTCRKKLNNYRSACSCTSQGRKKVGGGGGGGGRTPLHLRVKTF